MGEQNNVLILCMSTIQNVQLQYYYDRENRRERFYSCVSQLEPGCKSVLDLLNEKRGKQKLKIVVLNTEETANTMLEDKNKVAASGDNSAYEFFKSRITGYINGNEDNARYDIQEEKIDEVIKTEISVLIDGICNYDGKGEICQECQEIEGLSDVLKEEGIKKDVIAYAEKIEKVLKKALTDRLDERYKLSDEENALVGRIKEEKDSFLNDTVYKEQEEPDGEDLEKFFAGLKLMQEEFKDIKNTEKKIDDELWETGGGSSIFNKIAGLEKRCRELEVSYGLKIAELYQKQIIQDKTEEIAETYKKAIMELEENEKKLYGIILKLQRQLDDVKRQYQKTVLQYLRSTIWKKIVLPSAGNTKNKIYNVEITQWISVIIHRDIDTEIETIVNNIKSDNKEMPRIFVDTQGGYRDNIMVLASIIEMLKVSGVSGKSGIEEVTYAVNFNINNFANEIVTNTEKYKMFDMVSGMDEFLGYMHISKLQKFLKERQEFLEKKQEDIKLDKESDENTSKWLNEITQVKDSFITILKSISDDMLLCHVETIDKELGKFKDKYCEWYGKEKNRYSELKEELDNIKKKYGKKQKIQMEYIDSILSYLEIISFAVKNIKKYFVDIVVTRGRNNKTYVELPSILNWCIKRDMIQQALTLAEDKTASYLEEKEVIKFPEVKLDFVKKSFRYNFRENGNKYLCHNNKYLFEGFGLDIVFGNLYHDNKDNVIYCSSDGETKQYNKNVLSMFYNEIKIEVDNMLRDRKNYNIIIDYLKDSGKADEITAFYIEQKGKNHILIKNKKLPGIMYSQKLYGFKCSYNSCKNQKEKLHFLAFAMLHVYIKRQRNNVNHGQEKSLSMEEIKKLLEFYKDILHNMAK